MQHVWVFHWGMVIFLISQGARNSPSVWLGSSLLDLESPKGYVYPQTMEGASEGYLGQCFLVNLKHTPD